MLPKVFEIDEILRPIATHAFDLDGRSAIALARCCRTLEEPVLSLCWENQSLDRLAGALPKSVLGRSGDDRSPFYTFIRLPTQEERYRLLRYASWIKRIEGVVTRRLEAFFNVLQFSSPTETPFPNLRSLEWRVYPSLLRFLPLFVSPQMSTFSVSVYKDASFNPKTMVRDYLSTAVAALPAFLREFTLCISPAGLGSDELKEEVLYMVHRCGPVLTHLEIDVELPAIMVHHIIGLPNLHTWGVFGNMPPTTLAPPSKSINYLPSLRSLTLTATNTHDWAVFLASPHSTMYSIRSTLTTLNLRGRHDVDPILISQICAFTNLTHLDVGCSCPKDRCIFALSDDDISNLSLALPRLERLMLGHQCDKNTCQTTFRSLLFLSARCPSLAFISIHFNTVQIARDIQSMMETGDPSVKELRESPTRCQVVTPSVFQTPLSLVGPNELDVVKKGFLNVFPQLKGISRRYGRAWECLMEALGK